MKFTLLTTLFTLFGVSTAFLAEHEYQDRFNDFTTLYNKEYLDDEYQLRYDIFKGNLDTIDTHNNGDHSWTMGMNSFTDLPWHEFRNNHASYTPSSNLGFWINDNDFSVETPDKWDWVSNGAVTPVKNQGQCGSCWSFSTTGAIEGAWYVKTGYLISLSEQQLVDCSRSFGNQGCGGGLMNEGFKYVVENGICPESVYPYTATDGTCQTCNSSPISVSSFKDVAPSNETALQEAVFRQPISVALEADQKGWQFYKSGIMDGDCGTNLDH